MVSIDTLKSKSNYAMEQLASHKKTRYVFFFQNIIFLFIYGIRQRARADNLTISYCNHKNCNFLACDWFEKLVFSTNSLGKLLSDSLSLDSSLLDSLLSDSTISQSHHSKR